MLPSQFGRPKSSRSHMYRRTKRRRLPLVLGLLTMLIAAAVVFKWWPGSPEIGGAEAANSSSDPGTTGGVAMQPANASVSKVQEHKPVSNASNSTANASSAKKPIRCLCRTPPAARWRPTRIHRRANQRKR